MPLGFVVEVDIQLVRIEVAGKILFTEIRESIVGAIDPLDEFGVGESPTAPGDVVRVVVDVGGDNASRSNDLLLVKEFEGAIIRPGHPFDARTHSGEWLLRRSLEDMIPYF